MIVFGLDIMYTYIRGLKRGGVVLFSFSTNEKGITLVEVIAGMVIVTIVTLAVLSAVSQSAVLGVGADGIYNTSLVALKRVEDLRNMVFGDIPEEAPETDIEVDNDGDGVTDYFRTTEVEEDYDGYANLLHVKVTVYRASSGVKAGGPVVMETLIADISTE